MGKKMKNIGDWSIFGKWLVVSAGQFTFRNHLDSQSLNRRQNISTYFSNEATK